MKLGGVVVVVVVGVGARLMLLERAIAKGPFCLSVRVCPSVRLSVTLMSHAYTVRDIEHFTRLLERCL